MKNSLLLSFLLALLSGLLYAQTESEIRQITYSEDNSDLLFNPNLKPFYHGVASGDPTPNRVMLWTRITPSNKSTVINGTYQVAEDLAFTKMVATGTFSTNADRDFTVKIDQGGLKPFTHYYYRFIHNGDTSMIGRTKTAPDAMVDNLRFGVVSCSNFQAGYFNGYGFANQRMDIDYMLHLGDYIYEYGEGGYGYNDETQRGHEPNHEMVEIEDYRLRYSFYRMDENLMRLHQLYPMISTWDDHESTNDSYKDGAQNHSSDEGDWEVRKNTAAQVYSEWMPIRNPEADNPLKIWRTLGFGDLLDIIMIDTRIWGRDEQVGSVNDAAYSDPNRTILGKDQLAWFQSELKNSKATWRLIGNQVQIMLVETAPGQPLLLDPWDGYPAERDTVLRYIRDNEIDNVVFLTGDIHTSWAADLAIDPFSLNTPLSPDGYTALTQAGSVATEFVTPSITSDNFNEITGTPAGSSVGIEEAVKARNGHIRFVELDDHGFMVVDVNADRVQAQWYTGEILEKDTTPTLLAAYQTLSGSNSVSEATTNFEDEEDNAPNPPMPKKTTTTGINSNSKVESFGIYPNPATEFIKVQFGLAAKDMIYWTVNSMDGKILASGRPQTMNKGIYELKIDVSTMAAGSYLLQLHVGSERSTQPFIRK